MKKILLFACVEKNIGDDLFIYVLCNRYKHCNFVISDRAKYGNLLKIPNLSFSKAVRYLKGTCDYNSYIPRLKKLVGKIVYKTLSLFYGHKNFIVYIVGNTFKNYSYKGKEQIQWLKNMVNLSSKFYLLSTNYGPCDDERWINDCSEAFKKVTDICFRDKESFNLFSNLSNVRFAPDAVLTLKTDITKKQVNSKKIIISIINCRERYSEKVLEKADVYENKISEISDKYIESGFDVILLCSNTDQDYPAADRIRKKCKFGDKIRIFKYNGNYEDVFELYRESSCVISTRLHSMILAWIFKTPVFPISYDIKVSNLINSYNFNNDYCQLSNIEKLSYNKIIESFKNYDFTFLNNLQLEAEKQFSKLDTILEPFQVFL